MDTMTTVSEVLNALKKEGYTVDFNLSDNCLLCHGNNLQIRPDEFAVDKVYRFEGMSDPADEAVVYAISSDKHQLKGTLTNAYGIYSDTLSDDMIKALGHGRPKASDTGEARGETKFNEATPQRPEGTRPLDAPLVEIDVHTLRKQIKHEPAWKSSDRNALTLFKTSSLRIVLIALHAGAQMKTHTAPGIINVQVLEGKILFSTEQTEVELEEGRMLVLHAGIPHRVVARKESVFLLTLSTNSSAS